MSQPDEEYARKTKEQYEALGRFVEAFERMVADARNACLEMFRGLSGSPAFRGTHDALLHIVFHHQSMTAKPIWEIMRAMTAQILNDVEFRRMNNITDEDHATFLGVLASIGSEYADLINTRNNLLHGTWNIGWMSGYDPRPNIEEFFVLKGAPNKKGWATIELPRTVSGLASLSSRCEITGHWICNVAECMPWRHAEPKITSRFIREDKEWHCIWP